MNALAEFIRALRLAGYEIVLCGDFNAYTKDHVGFAGDESEFNETIPDDCAWPVRRKSACSHPRRNQNGKELIALCQNCELIIVNGAMVDGKLFDSGCTRDSNSVKGGSVIDYVLASASIFPDLKAYVSATLGTAITTPSLLDGSAKIRKRTPSTDIKRIGRFPAKSPTSHRQGRKGGVFLTP